MSGPLDAEHDSVRNRVDSLRKKDRLPFWRLAFADFLLLRIADYRLLHEDAEASETIRRLNRWVDLHERELSLSEKPQNSKVPLWNRESLKKETTEFQKKLSSKKYLIPVAERISFTSGIEKAQRLVEEGSFDLAYSELFALRSQLVSRLHRSYRARSAMMLYSTHQVGFGHSPTGTVVGPYNAEHTLENALSLVGERDAIWVEDFLELYDGISKITERLAPLERKRR